MNRLSWIAAGALATSGALATASTTVTVHLDCVRGSDAYDGATASTALRTVAAAQAAARRAGPGTTVSIHPGTCHVRETLRLTQEDAGTSWLAAAPDAAAPPRLRASNSSSAAAPPTPPPTISGGVPLTAASFGPVTDPWVASLLPPATAASVLQIDLAAALGGDWAAFGTLPCRPYCGGDASILPGNLVPTPPELFFVDPTSGDTAPLRLAQYPPYGTPVANWSHIAAVGSNSTRVAIVDKGTGARLSGWAAQLAGAGGAPAGSVAAHYYNPIGWADMHFLVEGIDATAGTITFSICGTGWDDLEAGAYFYSYNLLSEMSTPGTYVLNFTTGMAYVLPPSGATPLPPAPATVAVASSVGDLVTLTDTAYVSFTGIDFRHARGGGLVLSNASFITIADGSVADVGIMGVNVTGGTGAAMSGLDISRTGNGGVFMYAGDRASLTPGGHVVANSTIHDYSRYMHCYVPGVAMGDVGNSLLSSEVYDAPHQGVFMSGNNHVLDGCHIHDVVQIVRDSGAFYMGRDWTYRGNRITNNLFEDINTVQPGNDVSAVYLDDSGSGFFVANNTFNNVSRALLLGGGRANIFRDNTINGINSGDAAVHMDDRDEGWAKTACRAPGILVQFLARVPYNTSAVWIASYPDLPSILSDDPCLPKYNAVVYNDYCIAAGKQFTDVNASTFASWDSVLANNTATC